MESNKTIDNLKISEGETLLIEKHAPSKKLNKIITKETQYKKRPYLSIKRENLSIKEEDSDSCIFSDSENVCVIIIKKK